MVLSKKTLQKRSKRSRKVSRVQKKYKKTLRVQRGGDNVIRKLEMFLESKINRRGIIEIHPHVLLIIILYLWCYGKITLEEMEACDVSNISNIKNLINTQTKIHMKINSLSYKNMYDLGYHDAQKLFWVILYTDLSILMPSIKNMTYKGPSNVTKFWILISENFSFENPDKLKLRMHDEDTQNKIKTKLRDLFELQFTYVKPANNKNNFVNALEYIKPNYQHNDSLNAHNNRGAEDFEEDSIMMSKVLPEHRTA